MATQILIGNKLTRIPGIYTQIKSGIRNSSLQLSYGNICIIDTGMGAGYVSLPGVQGQTSEGSDSVFEFTTIQEFRTFVRGGIYWKLAENLFLPSGSNPGISKVYFVRAAATTSGSVTINLGSVGSFTIKSRDEGLAVNGLLNTQSELYKGFAVKLLESSFNAGSYRLQFYIGTYKGLDPDTNGFSYDGVSENDSIGNLVFSSPEFQTIDELYSWAVISQDFNDLFEITKTGDTDEIILPVNYTPVGPTYKLFTGGTETYGDAHYDRILNEISDLDNTFFLAPDSGVQGLSVKNTKLFAHIVSEARFEKFMILAGGDNRLEFKPISVEMARSYNSDRIILVHGAYKENSSITRSPVIRDAFFKAASILGRLCGLPPQVPITFKSFNWLAEVHPLTPQEKEHALEKGVLCTVRDTELGFIVLQGINTLQRNNYLLNEDASSYSIAVKRIVAQLNKEIVVNAKLNFFGTETGFNRGTATVEDIQSWLFGFLTQRVSNSLVDNLIITFRDIKVVLEGDCYKVTYYFVPNFEINKMVFTGVIVEQ